MHTVRFLFDYLSPYAWLAWSRLRRHGVALEPEPVLLAGVLNAHGQKGPAEIPAKRRYVMRDVLRNAAREGIEVAVPRSHPFNPLLALRLTCAVEQGRERLVELLFRRVWVEGLPVETADELRPALEAAGLPADELLAAAQSAEVKGRLRAQTEAAIAAGVFGVPTMIVGGELYWGNDAVGFVIEAAEGRVVEVPEEVSRAWDGLRGTASRLPG